MSLNDNLPHKEINSNMALLAAAWPALQPSVPRGAFEVFVNFPVELRLKIWKEVIAQPRLIHWRPGGGKAPALLRVNKEAREVALKKYTLCFNALGRDNFYAFYIDTKVDILYRKSALPNLTRMNASPAPLAPTLDVRPGVAGIEWNVRDWAKSVRSLCINIHEAMTIAHTRSGPQTVWIKVKTMFPDLEELTIVFPSISGGQLMNLRDFVDVNPGYRSRREQAQMTRLRADLFRVQGRGALRNLTMKFQTY